MNMKKKGWGAFLRRKQYVIAGALVVIAAIATTVVYSSEQEKERERVEAELAAEMQKNSQESNELAKEAETEETAPASALIPPETKETETETETAVLKGANTEETEATENREETEKEKKSEKTETAETVAQPEPLHFSPEDGIIWPLEGNVILNYSMDATVYFPTLDQYKYNPGVVIGGDVNSKVYSVAKGKISAISNDEVTGCTVTVDLGDGYQAIYGQLKELNFKEGDLVEAGHVLGYVGEPTKYFSVEGSNLYFELKKDGVPINPIEFFE